MARLEPCSARNILNDVNSVQISSPAADYAPAIFFVEAHDLRVARQLADGDFHLFAWQWHWTVVMSFLNSVRLVGMCFFKNGISGSRLQISREPGSPARIILIVLF